MSQITNLEEAVSRLSSEFGIPLTPKEIEESALGEEKTYLARLHSGDSYQGTFCLVTEKGEIKSAAYKGSHPARGEVQFELDTKLFHCDGFGTLLRLGRKDTFRYEAPFLGNLDTFDVTPIDSGPGIALRYVLEKTQP